MAKRNESVPQLQVEVGDVLLKVNGTDVNRFSTREGKDSDSEYTYKHTVILHIVYIAAVAFVVYMYSWKIFLLY